MEKNGNETIFHPFGSFSSQYKDLCDENYVENFFDPESETCGFLNNDLTLFIHYFNGDEVCEFGNGIQIYSFSNKDWYDWTDDQVLNWLRKIDISSEGFVHWDNEIRLNGKNLKMYYRDLVEKYDFNLNDANLIQREIEKLKRVYSERRIIQPNYPRVVIDLKSRKFEIITENFFNVVVHCDEDNTGSCILQIYLPNNQGEFYFEKNHVSFTNPILNKIIYNFSPADQNLKVTDNEDNFFDLSLQKGIGCSWHLSMEKNNTIEGSKERDTIPLKYYAPPSEPLLPKVFLVRSDGTGWELLKEEAQETKNECCSLHEDNERKIILQKILEQKITYPNILKCKFKKQIEKPLKSISTSNVRLLSAPLLHTEDMESIKQTIIQYKSVLNNTEA